jgi:UDP-4-amino-4-deoxy-L-arabinose formyltransferase/UDP-glucuronic acid dehydrogenase (UDP-4-keto-hexauronic acid decarboxylating)
LIRKLLETAAENPQAIPAIEQDLSRREYFGKGTPEDGWLAWSRPAREIINFVRAADYSPFPSPWRNPRSRMGDREVAFVKAVLNGAAMRRGAGDDWPIRRRPGLGGRRR